MAVVIDLEGEFGNPFYILHQVSRALTVAGATDAEVALFEMQATAGNFTNLLKVVEDWVVVVYKKGVVHDQV